MLGEIQVVVKGFPPNDSWLILLGLGGAQKVMEC